MNMNKSNYPYHAVERFGSHNNIFMVRKVLSENSVVPADREALTTEQAAIDRCIELTGSEPKKIGSIWEII